MIIPSNKGTTVLEIVMAVAIIAILSAVILPNLATFNREQALNNTTADIISLLNKAKSDADSLTLATNYSVHFESTRAVYFLGTSFTEPNASNIEVLFDSAVTIPVSGGINLNGGGSNITFTRQTGDTRGYVTGYGTIVIQLTSDPARQKTITINRTGSVSVN